MSILHLPPPRRVRSSRTAPATHPRRYVALVAPTRHASHATAAVMHVHACPRDRPAPPPHTSRGVRTVALPPHGSPRSQRALGRRAASPLPHSPGRWAEPLGGCLRCDSCPRSRFRETRLGVCFACVRRLESATSASRSERIIFFLLDVVGPVAAVIRLLPLLPVSRAEILPVEAADWSPHRAPPPHTNA